MDHDVSAIDLREKLGRGENVSNEPVDARILGIAVLETLPRYAGKYLLMARTEADCWTSREAK
jgi:hypothetical protein